MQTPAARHRLLVRQRSTAKREAMSRREQPSEAPSGYGYGLGMVRVKQWGSNPFGGENGV